MKDRIRESAARCTVLISTQSIALGSPQRGTTHIFTQWCTVSTETEFWYSIDGAPGRGGIGIPKVILNFNGKQYSHPLQNDWEGKLGMSQLSYGIPITSKEDGELVLRAVATPLFQKLIAASNWGAFQTDYRMFRSFRDDWPQWVIAENAKP